MSEYVVDVNDSSEMYAVEMGRYEELREVIRCKDCKHYRYVLGYIDGLCGRAEWYKRYQREDDYCSRAERKEE